ncbi:MAG TPA: metallophosphoesterase [Polyangia bacterium]|nr:metallophosphoesterase [Polyangia bacterium]
MGHRACILLLGLVACGRPGPFRYQAAVSDAGLVRGPYLQVGTPTSAVVRWRTISASGSRVTFGAALDALDSTVERPELTTEHEVPLDGLMPATRYYYAVGSGSQEVAGAAADQFFVTPPLWGTRRPVRIWAIGDSGTGDKEAARVRDAYRRLTGGMSAYTDIWLMLGDNAYPNGEDDAYQRAVFEMYPMFLRQSFLWPTIGNHDTAEDPNLPADRIAYLGNFTLPTQGEAGGLPSGTERYYSFDFADVHFVCLDSMTSDRHPEGAMMTWLEADLLATTRQWIIAFWHHPPYSKGNHDSDYQTEMIEMRQWALPILERHGVDLVLNGHSHTYERSFLLDGHYGSSQTFEPGMKKDPGGGRASEGAPYHKATSGQAPHEGAVYVVAGNAGHINAVGPHPAMFLSLSRLGSVVVDVDGARLDVRFLRETGFIDDAFTILKGLQENLLPRVRMLSPPDGATASSPRVPLAAEASDPDGSIRRVDFYLDTVTWIGSAESAPYQGEWLAIEGVHQLAAVATDDRGARVTSLPVTITVPVGVGTALPPPPPPPPDAAVDAAEIDGGGDVDGETDAGGDAHADADGADGGLRSWRQAGTPGVGCGIAPQQRPRFWAVLLLGALAQRRRRNRERS